MYGGSHKDPLYRPELYNDSRHNRTKASPGVYVYIHDSDTRPYVRHDLPNVKNTEQFYMNPPSIQEGKNVYSFDSWCTWRGLV